MPDTRYELVFTGEAEVTKAADIAAAKEAEEAETETKKEEG
jgi:hypothetical protein